MKGKFKKTYLIIISLVLFSLVFTGCFGGSGSGGGVSKAKTGDLVVEVLNKETNKALAEQVTLTLGTSTPKTTTTGRAEFKSIAVGTLNLKVEAKGYKTVTQKVEIKAGSTTVKVQLEKENPTEPPKLGSLEVTVKDSTTNKEVTTATVIVGGRGALLKEGKYVAMDLEVGEHTLQVTAVGFKTHSRTVTIVADQAVKEEVMLEKLPAQLGELSGKITNEKDGKLITTEVTVNLAGTAKKVTGGMYSFTDLTPGKKTLKVTAPGFLERVTEVTIVAGKTEVKDISLKEEPPKLGNLEVMVKDSETTNAIPNAHVNIGSKTATFKDGKYSFTNLEVGEHTLQVSAEGYQTFGKKVVIKADQTTKEEVKLEKLPYEVNKLTIKLHDEATNKPINSDFIFYQIDGGENLIGSNQIILNNLEVGKIKVRIYAQGYKGLSYGYAEFEKDIEPGAQEEVVLFKEASNTARISLKVIDSQTKNPLTEGVSIEDGDTSLHRHLVEGVFEYVNLPTANSVTLTITKDGYVEQMPLKKYRLTKGEHKKLTVELKKLGEQTGIVEFEFVNLIDGTPVTGLEISSYGPNSTWTHHILEKTNNKIRIEDVWTGERDFNINGPGYQEHDLTIDVLETGVTRARVDLTPTHFYNLYVELYDAIGDTYSSPENAAPRLSGREYDEFSDGCLYSFEEIYAGNYDLEITAPNYKAYSKRIRVGHSYEESKNRESIVVYMEPAGTVYFNIKDFETRKPLNNVQILVKDSFGHWIDARAKTESGQYRVDIWPGMRSFMIEAEGYNTEELDLNVSTMGIVKDINLRKTKITFTVEILDQNHKVTKRPIEVHLDAIKKTTTTGIVVFEDVIPGSYRLDFFSEDGFFYNETTWVNIEKTPLEQGVTYDLTARYEPVDFDGAYVWGKEWSPFPTGYSDDEPASLAYNYEMGKFLVTTELWEEVRDWAVNHSGKGYRIDHIPDYTDDKPIQVKWYEAVVWCNAYTEYYNFVNGTSLGFAYRNLQGDVIRNALGLWPSDVKVDSGAFGFRMPLSLEWELAARYRGDDDRNFVKGYANPYFTKGNSVSGAANYTTIESDKYAWFGSNPVNPVGKKRPNHLDIYDMSGNVWEWCSDVQGNGNNSVPLGRNGGGSLEFAMIRHFTWGYVNVGHGFRLVRRR